MTDAPKSNQSHFLPASPLINIHNFWQTHLNTSQNGDNFKTETTHIEGTCLSTSLINSSIWIIDSSASSHIYYDKSMFKHLHKTQNISVILPNKTRLKVKYIRDISIANEVILRDVLYIPDFKYNLLSVSALLKDERFAVSFSNSNCLIQDKLLSKMIGRVELTNELYLLRIKNEKINHTTIMCKASTSTWHKRMGYPSISRIKELAKMIEISNSSITRNREFPMHKTTS